MDKRKDKRIAANLYVKLNFGSKPSWGLLYDVSENGLFIRSSRDFTIGTVIDIEIFMPDNNNTLREGIVRRKIELPESHRKFGIGVEITEKDSTYGHFVKFLNMQTKIPVQTLSRNGNS